MNAVRYSGKKGLISYFWGEPGSEGRLIRQNAIITGVLTVLSLLLLIYTAQGREGLDIVITPDYNFGPRFNQSGELVNAFLVSIENRQKADDRIFLRTSEQVRVSPNFIYLKGGEFQRVRIIVIAKEESPDVSLFFFSSAQNKTITKEITLQKT